MTTVEPFDALAATEADAVALHALRAAADAVDFPPDRPADTLDQVRAQLASTRTDRRLFWWLARDGGEPTGFAVLRLPLLDNQHLGLSEVVVRPGARRRGTGSALLRTALTTLLEQDRRLLVGYSAAGGAGDEFAAALGVELTQTAAISRLEFDRVRWDEVAATVAAPHPGYRLVAHTGRCPDELIESYARAKNAMNDAPSDGMDVTDHLYTAETLRTEEVTAAKYGEARVVFAVAEASGEVVAFTEVLLLTGRAWASQEDTAVVPAHRGRGLGLWVKADMLRRLRTERPDAVAILTGNSSTNATMLRINERLGFRLWTELHNWQADAATLADRLRPARAAG